MGQGLSEVGPHRDAADPSPNYHRAQGHACMRARTAMGNLARQCTTHSSPHFGALRPEWSGPNARVGKKLHPTQDTLPPPPLSTMRVTSATTPPAPGFPGLGCAHQPAPAGADCDAHPAWVKVPADTCTTLPGLPAPTTAESSTDPSRCPAPRSRATSGGPFSDVTLVCDALLEMSLQPKVFHDRAAADAGGACRGMDFATPPRVCVVAAVSPLRARARCPPVRCVFPTSPPPAPRRVAFVHVCDGLGVAVRWVCVHGVCDRVPVQKGSFAEADGSIPVFGVPVVPLGGAAGPLTDPYAEADAGSYYAEECAMSPRAGSPDGAQACFRSGVSSAGPSERAFQKPPAAASPTMPVPWSPKRPGGALDLLSVRARGVGRVVCGGGGTGGGGGCGGRGGGVGSGTAPSIW